MTKILGMIRRRGIRRHAIRRHALPLALVLCGLAGPALAQGEVRATHGDWVVRCDTPAGASTEQCALTQTVLAEDRDNIGLNVIVLKTADQKARLLRVVAPLGVALPYGLGLTIDGENIGSVNFVRCLPEGCVAEVILEDALLTRLRNGTTATFIIFQTPEEGIGIPVSLAGFGEGFDALP
jgi:invasion protein IalB